MLLQLIHTVYLLRRGWIIASYFGFKLYLSLTTKKAHEVKQTHATTRTQTEQNSQEHAAVSDYALQPTHNAATGQQTGNIALSCHVMGKKQNIVCFQWTIAAADGSGLLLAALHDG